MNIIVNNFQDKWKGIIVIPMCEGFLDRQIEMEPLDWAKEEAKMAKIIRHIYVYC